MHYQIHCIDVKNALQNYIWMLEHIDSGEVVAIDPTEASLVQQFCQDHGLKLTQIWLTHWHKDHIGGVPKLLQQQQIAVYGPALEYEKIPFLSHQLHDLDIWKFHDLNIQAMSVPGHTLGHMLYHLADIQKLFSGDTLFAMGCGRVFEGTYTQMYQALQRIKQLPLDTEIYCTHEYTRSNAQFAQQVEPDNLAIQMRLRTLMQDPQRCSLPTRLDLECATNPFLRATTVAEFTRLRQLKDQF